MKNNKVIKIIFIIFMIIMIIMNIFLVLNTLTISSSNKILGSVSYSDYLDSSKVTYLDSNVQDSIDNLYTKANDYSSINNRVLTIESLITDDAGFHNSIYRGKDITSYYNDGSLYTRISSGKFEDLYVGDYIIKNDITWRIAGFDIYYNKGDTALTTHHAVIVPDTNLTSGVMNDTNTTEGGYVGSKMYTSTLPNVLSTYITPVFGSHVLEYRNLLTTSVNTGLTNRTGSASGASNNWAWETRKLDLMNENQVSGSIEWSSSGFETGSDNVQFPLFRLKPEFVQKQRVWYWLRNVTTSSAFAGVGTYGDSGHNSASASGGIRPCFYID